MEMVKNIQDAFDLTPKEWAGLEGKKVHLGVGVGQITEKAVFHGLVSREQLLVLSEHIKDDDPLVLNALHNANKVRIELNGRIEDFYWGDIVELWPVEKNCDHCNGSGKFNVGAGNPQFSALAWLEDHEETCNSCGGSGKVSILSSIGSAD